MSVLVSSGYKWLRRHKNKLIVSGAVVGGVYGGGKYLSYRLIKYLNDQQKRMNVESTRRYSFEKCRDHCRHLLPKIFSRIKEEVAVYVSTGKILDQLKSGRGDKRQLWQELKVAVFTQLAALVYLTSTATVLIAAHLNQTAAMLLKSQEGNEEDHERFLQDSISKLINGNLLSLIVTKIKTASSRHITSVPLTRQISFVDVENFLNLILMEVSDETDTENQSNSRFLANKLLDSDTEDVLRMSMADVLASPDFDYVLWMCIQSTLRHAGSLTKISIERFCLDPVSCEDEVSTLPVAKLLPLLNKIRLDFELVDCLLDTEDLVRFSENVFEAFVVAN